MWNLTVDRARMREAVAKYLGWLFFVGLMAVVRRDLHATLEDVVIVALLPAPFIIGLWSIHLFWAWVKVRTLSRRRPSSRTFRCDDEPHTAYWSSGGSARRVSASR